MTVRPPPYAVGLAAGLVTAWWYLRNPGRTVGTAVSDLASILTGTIRLTEQQREMIAVIDQRFAAAGFAWLAPAAVANAYAESRLDPTAAGDSGASVGLFQLHERYAGKGLTVEQRQNPRINTDRILEVVRGPEGAEVRAARGSATNAELAELFAHFIERCAACGHNLGSAQLVYRADLVSKLFGPELAATVPR